MRIYTQIHITNKQHTLKDEQHLCHVTFLNYLRFSEFELELNLYSKSTLLMTEIIGVVDVVY